MNKTWPTVVATAALSFAAYAAPAHAACAAPDPVGSWQATVTRPGVTENITIDFYGDGHVCLFAGGGKSPGQWSTTGSSEFNFKVKENLLDESGQVTGWVRIDQDAVQSGDAFTSEGISKVYDSDGTLTGTLTAQVDGTRQSPDPSGTAC